MIETVVEVVDLIDKDVWRHGAGRRRIGRWNQTASTNKSTDKRWERNKQQNIAHGGEGTTLNGRFVTRPHWLFCDRPGFSAKLILRLAIVLVNRDVCNADIMVSIANNSRTLTNAHIDPRIPGIALSVFEEVWSLRFKLVTGRGERKTGFQTESLCKKKNDQAVINGYSRAFATISKTYLNEHGCANGCQGRARGRILV